MSLRLILALLLVALGGPAVRGEGSGRPAPDFTGGGPWLNTTDGLPLSLAALRGKVVLVEFWTGGCINCLNTLPWVKQWDTKYRAQGLVIIGVHSPEFAHEHDVAYVREKIARLGIRYPVVMDNAFRIWRAYNNAYWPTMYLIDKRGTIRLLKIGEGNYDDTESRIRLLLAEQVPGVR